MSNGKMTFRFDTGTGKDGQAGKGGELDSGSGYLGTARDYSTNRYNSADSHNSTGRPDSVDSDYSGREQNDNPGKSYITAPHRNIDAPGEVWPYNAAGNSAGGDQYGGYKNRTVEPAPQPDRYKEWVDLSHGPGPVRSSDSSLFRPDPLTGLRETTTRRIPDDVQEEEYGYSARYNEDTDNGELREFGDISYSGLSYGTSGSYQTRRPASWWKFALSITGALGTGLLLGYAALNFISGVNDSGDGRTLPAVVQNGAAGGAAGQPVDPATGLPAAGENSTAGRIPVAIAAQSYYLLQYGVFSTPAGAEKAQQELLAAGLAAGTDPDGGNRVYAGISPDREQAKLLSSGLQHQGIELYVREVTLPAAEQAAFAGQAEAVNSYFAVSAELLNELSSLSATLLSGAGGAADTAAVTDLHMRWTEAVKALEPGLSAEGQSLCAGLEKSASQGIAALNEYNKNQAQGLLWEVQESVMSFLSGQKTLLSLLE
ncbi:SPOR domain-containing protein [Paenibacillus sp. FSL R7-0331]|uniref:SPOR domain-containing protein n=1 Tax=Paenibacillus sp. FSL R7-0331 TaxID=1536773 RepID=UPI0006945D3E|nr:SPOR domain-containing protein [Paenibacillus sp. FSL R7-0331]